MFRKLLFLLVLACSIMPVQTHAAGITNYSTLIHADYWMQHNPQGNEIILDKSGIEAYNARIREASPTVYSMKDYPETISGDALKTKIMNYLVLEDELFLHGNKVSENYKNILRRQTNVGAIPNEVKVKYAVTVRRANLRNLPTGEGLYYFVNDKDFDALQETTLDPSEPLAVLHASANGFFYYVQSVNYSGWISKYDLAFTDKATWNKFADPDKFLIVTDKSYRVKIAGEMVEYQLGARLPLKDETKTTYILEAPTRNKAGNLLLTKIFINKNNKAVYKGYLPYTANNIVQSAFKFYNAPYGWGGLKNSVDCSSLVFNVYRAAGIFLPRNADEQENTAGKKYNLTDMNEADKAKLIGTLTAGSALYMDGHTVIYLGQNNDTAYVIHALGTYYSQGRKIREMRVAVSDLSLQRYSGKTFLHDINTAIEFK